LNLSNFQPQLKQTPPPKMNMIKKTKFNSTATLFMKDCMEAPDKNEIIACFSKCLHWRIIEDSKLSAKGTCLQIFDENFYPLEGITLNEDNSVPTIGDIKEFLELIYNSQKLEPENVVMASAYIERLLNMTKMKLQVCNWRRITVAALLVASKVWEDLTVWNIDFLESFPEVSVADLNKLEWQFLVGLQFNVVLRPSIYAKYYFELRSLSDLTEKNFPPEQLNRQGVEELEARSHGIQVKLQRFKSRRTKSLNEYTSPAKIMLEQVKHGFKASTLYPHHCLF